MSGRDGWREMNIDGLINAIGPLLSRRDGEGWRYALEARPEHANPLGVIHGGTLMTLLDQTATLSAMWLSGEKAMLSVQMNTRFFASAKVGDFIEGQASLRSRTRSMLFLDAQLTVDGGAVADASVIMKIIKPKPPNN